jgi:hypothetical protein
MRYAVCCLYAIYCTFCTLVGWSRVLRSEMEPQETIGQCYIRLWTVIRQGIFRHWFIFYFINICVYSFCFNLFICWTGSTRKRTQFRSSLSQLLPHINNKTMRYWVLEEWNLYIIMCPQGVNTIKRFAFSFPNVNVAIKFSIIHPVVY